MTKVEEYGVTPETRNNLPIIQLIIDFLGDEILLVGGPNLEMPEWYTLRNKKELLEKVYETHPFGFLNYGSGEISTLVENGEFLKYLLGMVASVIPILHTSSITKLGIEQVFAFQYLDKGELLSESLTYHRKFDKNSPLSLLHAYDLIGMKSLLFNFLLLMREKGLTFRAMKDESYQNHLHVQLEEANKTNEE